MSVHQQTSVKCLQMFVAKFLKFFLISSALLLIAAHGRPMQDFSSEDDRINEISEEFDRKPIIMPNVDRIFSSAEMQTPRRDNVKTENKINKNSEETTKSSKHAHTMITSMLSFVSSVLNFGKTIIRNE